MFFQRPKIKSDSQEAPKQQGQSLASAHLHRATKEKSGKEKTIHQPSCRHLFSFPPISHPTQGYVWKQRSSSGSTLTGSAFRGAQDSADHTVAADAADYTEHRLEGRQSREGTPRVPAGWQTNIPDWGHADVERGGSPGSGSANNRPEHLEIWLVQTCVWGTEGTLGLTFSLDGAEAAWLRSGEELQEGLQWEKAILPQVRRFIC